MSLAPSAMERRGWRGSGLPARLVAVYLSLTALNLGAWAWAVGTLRHHPALLGVAVVVYGLGLRHAVDADHIAAIDNVTRKLLKDGRRPVSVGFFFALGHSTVVVLVTMAVTAAATLMVRFRALRDFGEVVGTAVSSGFLVVVALANLRLLISLTRAWRRRKGLESHGAEDLERLLQDGGFVLRLLRPVLDLIYQSWHMFPLGFLFRLSFDTATEVATFGVSSAQTAHGLPLSCVLVFPVLFAAGMALVDTSDGVMMLGVYAWADGKPFRRMRYNMVVTLASVLLALVIAAVQICNFMARHFRARGVLAQASAFIGDHFGQLGLGVMSMFALGWLFVFLLSKRREEDCPQTSGAA